MSHSICYQEEVNIRGAFLCKHTGLRHPTSDTHDCCANLSARLGVQCGCWGSHAALGGAGLGQVQGWWPQGLAQGHGGDVPYSPWAAVGPRRHCDRSLTLRDLLGAGRRRANLGLGKVDEELSTVTKENKPHSLTIPSC